MADFALHSLRGGLNNTDPAISLSDDQATVAQNVEWVYGMIADRRLGSDAISLSATLAASDRVTFLHRDLPTADETAARLWAFGVTGTSSSTLEYKDTSWHVPTLKDAFTITGIYPNRIRAVSLHGKTFIAYKSGQDRLHVYDGSTVRRSGVAEPAAPTGANTAAAGSFTGTRYYRVRYIEKSGSTVLRRSEPSDVLTFAPSGSKTGVTVTKPASISEGETHWELEASLNNSDFYVLATTAVGTSSVDDTTDYSTGYTAYTLSEDTGDYALIGSAKFLAVDDDRLIWAGSFDDANLASRLGWTPVYGADGVGNDERFETDTDPFKDLDAGEGGGCTGLSEPQNGSFYFFKFSQIHKADRTGQRTKAYDTFALTKKKGAIEGSVVDGEDATGEPCVYFIDPKTGPARVGQGGIFNCGRDIRRTWKQLNLDATQLIATGLYYPDKHQVHWWIATGSSNVPDVHIVLHTHLTRLGEDGVRRGWAIWTGATAAAQCACLFADNIDDGTARSLSLVPFVGMAGSGNVHRCDTGDDDNGTEFTATVKSKPLTPASVVQHYGVTSGAVVAIAASGASIDVSLVRDRGLETVTVSDISLAPTASETDVIKDLDNLTLSEWRLVEIQVSDVDTPGSQWQVDQIVLRGYGEQGA
jgi:hypothetical protein